jgi:hypothetical protein
MAAGVAGIVAQGLGAPAPVLTCLLLVGLGADADLARRADRVRAAADEAGPDTRTARWAWVVSPLRAGHAMLYVLLYFTAWGGLCDAASTPWDRLTLFADLTATAVLLLGLGRRAAKASA